MRKLFMVMLIALGFLGASSGAAFALSDAQYPYGVEGIKAASAPPPGLYFKCYSLFYWSDDLRGRDGETQVLEVGAGALPAPSKAKIFAVAPRLIWITEHKFLGANVGMDVILPIFVKDLTITQPGGAETIFDDSDFGFGDLIIEPLIMAWHGARYDASAGMGLFFPLGGYWAPDNPNDLRLNAPGSDMWTGLFSAGGTFYIDADKTWSVSLLARYEIHSKQIHSDFNPGDDLGFEWGLGKTFPGADFITEAGVVGYSQWQITDDKNHPLEDPREGVGMDGTGQSVHAVGPEVSVFVPSWKTIISIKALIEFDAVNTFKGNRCVIGLTRIL